MTRNGSAMLLMKPRSLRERSPWRSKWRAFQLVRSLLTLFSLGSSIFDAKLCVRVCAMRSVGRLFPVLPSITDSAVNMWAHHHT
jgi:hypothetical protein